MIDLRFENFGYYPTLRTRQAELKGLSQLDAERKRKIVPLLTMGRWPKALDFGRSAEKAAEAMDGGYYFLDLTNDARHLSEQHGELRSAVGAFENWRKFVATYPQAIPVVQFSADSKVRDVTKQAQQIEKTVGKLAFRIRDFATETPLVINALSALENPTNAIVFIDSQYIRNALSAYLTATVATINRIRSEFPEVVISMLATSFPSSTVPFADSSHQRGSIDMQERDMHSRLGGNGVIIYGDHASIHSVVYDDSPIMRWAARVDYPRELDWYFERRPGVQTADGYIDAAKGIVAADDELGTRNIWGEAMIIQAAGGDPHAKAPGPWISVRVNIHLARQIDFSERLALGDDDGFDEGEDI